jgi:hypothetical protein
LMGADISTNIPLHDQTNLIFEIANNNTSIWKKM